ncbi:MULTISPECIES: methionine ABC transporter permease [Glutamicibacter]|uniref:ABC transporter permease n=1 Tax=Glutamicibacter halophytocola TaxID=1933880 RepID=A0A5B8I045_9MICC|nr:MULTISPECIES: methionine ABC transporter permease [Glutamicibacter]ALG29449.1 metal ABC transporter permease [Glutamicibacter halophytocola]MBF6672716.1 ABC transporter permease [Glutamicibacter sp. FBE19]NQD41092.1 ABC transporter permease [Glutamicibacter halophytocola]QDY65719.1 ABC transporter permease [Glutamicibacter halophytocola]UUX57821.1 ABC transporter permease [Glutamicibacter halophytocola]
MDFFTPTVLKAMGTATVETLQMVVISGIITVVIGLILGILLHVTDKGGLTPIRWLNVVLSAIIVNITRSIPFAILMVALIPFSAMVVGASLGPIAASVSLTIGTIPFFARLVETALRDVSTGKVDAALVMGSTKMQTIRKVLVPEAMPGIIAAVTTTVVTLIGYSAMAGLVGGGGLGRMAYTYGYTRYNMPIMLATIIIIVVLVQLVQIIGDAIARKVDHR